MIESNPTIVAVASDKKSLENFENEFYTDWETNLRMGAHLEGELIKSGHENLPVVYVVSRKMRLFSKEEND